MSSSNTKRSRCTLSTIRTTFLLLIAILFMGLVISRNPNISVIVTSLFVSSPLPTPSPPNGIIFQSPPIPRNDSNVDINTMTIDQVGDLQIQNPYVTSRGVFIQWRSVTIGQSVEFCASLPRGTNQVVVLCDRLTPNNIELDIDESVFGWLALDRRVSLTALRDGREFPVRPFVNSVGTTLVEFGTLCGRAQICDIYIYSTGGQVPLLS